MTNIRNRSCSVILTFLLMGSQHIVLGKVNVVITNKLGNGRTMNIHCRSRDDDLGHHSVADGSKIFWKFSVNFWGTTLFYCNVKWDDSKWHGFIAYSYERDSDRCERECIWKISADGLLYKYNEVTAEWEFMPFQDGQ
ncbi:self-incompatibility protein S1 [Manihot esculenta]|uniref:S-protein homolog n=1 Tax=Manihot esculenta TaxID=3983 RepID=A0A2C9V7Q7_MANES|nr:self-incompatibility protein S1 [Manihot esculenta]OAY40726.1 hypothetical protein MANES_09G044300v8 [Manihot esculenta]